MPPLIKQAAETHNDKPSRLKSQDSLILQTYSAQQLYKGTKKGPVGLQKFSALMLRVWQAAAKDDPFADQCLLDVYNLFIKAIRLIQKVEADYRKQWEGREGIEIGLAAAENPVKLPLHFKTPYGHMAAYLLADYDRCCRLLVTLKYAALMDSKQANDELRQLRREVRRVFSRPLQWQYTGVTRADLAANNMLAEQARAKMRLLSQDVVEAKLRAPFAPLLK